MDRDKMRPDVLEAIDIHANIAQKMAKKYFLKKFYMIPRIMPIIKRMNVANEKYLKERTMDYKVLETMMRTEEVRFIARLTRDMNEAMMAWYNKTYPYPSTVNFEAVRIGEIPAEWQVPSNAKADKTILYFHGGGGCVDSVNRLRPFTVDLATRLGIKVLSIDYRLAPENPFPAAVDDCYAADKWLLENGQNPRSIILAGESQGGNMALTTIVKAKQAGDTLPAGCMCFSPGADYSIDASWFDHADTDPILSEGFTPGFALAYMHGADPQNPLVSPARGDFRGCPPMLIQSSTTEMLRYASINAATKARSDGVDITFTEYPGMIHGFTSWGSVRYLPKLPEVDAAWKEIEHFIDNIL